jgi:imidazolonepropionase-like amidohydrolase
VTVATGLDQAPGLDPGAFLAVRAKRVLDTSRGRWITDSVVVLQEGRILEVGASVPEGAALLDLGDRSLLPGLVDAHTHIFLQGNHDQGEYAEQILAEDPAHRVARAVRSLTIALQHGFTTLRDLGTEGAGFADVALRSALEEGVLRGPTLQVAGPAIGATHSYPISSYRSDWAFPVGVAECDGVEGCRREVRRQISRGVDWIKVYVTSGSGMHVDQDGYPDSPPPWTMAELQTIVDVAHENGLPVAAHAMAATGTEMAVAAGVDSIEHGTAIRPATAASMAERGIALVPTLLALREQAGQSFQNCRRAGVPIVFGTDVGAFYWDEHNQARELELLVDLGLTPWEAIQSATVAAAKLLRRSGDLGDIRAGACADLVACPGDPLRDVGALLKVDVVIKGGAVAVAPAQLRPAQPARTG